MIGLSLEGGNRVEVGDHGERWLATPRGRQLANGFVPEPIIGVVASSTGEIGFATRDGTIYPVKASDPLGPVGEPRKPPRALTKIAFGAHAMVASAGRDLVRSSDVGRTWTPVDIGGAPRVLESIALARDGTGALLQLPQRTLVTDDDGLTWTHATAPPHGVSEVKSEDDRARVVAYSISAQTTMQVAGKPARWIPPRSTPPSTASTVNEPVLGYLQAWTTGEGVMAGTSWLEVTGSETGPELWIEDLAGVAPNRRIAAFAECSDIARVAASPDGRLLGVTCRKSPRSLERLVFRSVDAGEHWTKLPPVTADTGALFLGIKVVGEHLVVTGACATDRALECPLQATSSSGGTWTNLPLDAKPKKPLRLDEVAANPAGAGFVGMAYDDSGDVVYAIAAASLDRVVVTRTFEDLRGVEQLSWDGTVAVLQSGSPEAPLYVSRDAGQTWSGQPFLSELDDREGVSFAGARGLAITPTGVLESLDAGVTWSRLDAPPLPGAHGVRCARRGCLLDETLRRLGWSARSATSMQAAPRGASNERKTITIADPVPETLFTCAQTAKSDALAGTIDSPLVDLPNGVNASFLLYGTDGVRLARERGGVRELSGPIKHSPPLGFQVVSEPEGASFAEFPGECALNCHGFLYSSTGPIVVSWLPATGGPLRRVSFMPDAKMLREPLDATPTADGGVIVAVAGDAYVFDPNGKRTNKVRGHAWDVVTIDKKPYSTMGAITLIENGASPAPSPATTWVFEPFASERAHVVRARGQAYAWTQAKNEAFLVKLDKIEEEPSTVIGIDADKLLGTKPFPLCAAKTRGELRIPLTFDPPFPSLRIALPGPSEAWMLPLTDVVLRATSEGKACVSGVVARSADRQKGVMIDVADPLHATVWTNKRGTATTETLRCTAGRGQ